MHAYNVVYLLLHLHAVEAADDDSADTDESGVGFKKIGTAIGELDLKYFVHLILCSYAKNCNVCHCSTLKSYKKSYKKVNHSFNGRALSYTSTKLS